MKKNKNILLIAALALTGALMTACGGNEGDSSFSAITVDGDVYAIRNKGDKTLSYVSVGETIDLDEYFEVEMMDGSTISTFSIDNPNNELTIDGHKVTPNAIGSYEIMLAVNDRFKYVTINCKSEKNIELIKFLKKFEDSDGKNYTIDLGSYNRHTDRFTYEDYSIIHNQNYALAFNASDPGETDDDGESASFCLANLNDGNGYIGALDEDGKPVFEFGKTNIGNYYICLPMLLDGDGFTSTFNPVTNEEMLVGNSIQAEKFLNYGLSNFPSYYGYTTNSLYVLNLTDADNDGEKDTIYFKITVDGTSKSGVSFTDEEYAVCRVSNVGTTKYEPLEIAITDDSYVPKALDVTELQTAFEKIGKADNYTTTMNFYACDSSGKALADDDFDLETSTIGYLVGGNDVTERHTITEDGVEASLSSGDKVYGKKAYWNDGGKAYEGTYSPASGAGDDATEEVNTKEEIADCADVFTKEDVLAYTAKGVTSENIGKAIWKKKVTEDNIVALTGDIGDNNSADGQTNGFFEELFNQARFLMVETSNKTYGFGEYLTMDGTVQYQDGSTASFTVSSSYNLVTVDTTSNEIVVQAIIHLPFSDITAPYMMAEYTISEIGTTTNSFVYGE